MAPRNQLSWPKGRVSYPSLNDMFDRAAKRPYVGVTQGGSSRPDRGAKSAATKGENNASVPQN